MRLLLPCVSCVLLEQAGDASQPQLLLAELEGEHHFRTTCSLGHTSVLALTQPRFLLLYESGAHALMDGYYREAVASFASALERFHEFWLRATLLQNGVPAEALNNGWKLVGGQTERQLGAFVLVFLQQTGQQPPVLPEKMVKLRNTVIHKGDFPSRAAAVEYGDQVLKLIAPMNRQLQVRAPKGVAELRSENWRGAEGENVYPGGLLTILGRATDLAPRGASLEDELVHLAKRRKGSDRARPTTGHEST